MPRIKSLEADMRKVILSMPELGLVAGTRALLGAGIGLLLADKLNQEQRKAVGWTLFLVGAATTIPLALDVFSNRQVEKEER
jgi:hypothetical protein